MLQGIYASVQNLQLFIKCDECRLLGNEVSDRWQGVRDVIIDTCWAASLMMASRALMECCRAHLICVPPLASPGKRAA